MSNKRANHTLLFFIICCALAIFISVANIFRGSAANPISGTITPSGPMAPFTGTWSGTGSGVPPTGGGEDSCTEGTNCDTFKLTISGVPADWANKKVHVQINWGLAANDYDMYIHKGAPDGPIVATSGAGGTNQEQVDLNPLCASNIGTGDFYIHVVYFAATMADQYSGTVTVISAPACVGPAPQGSGVAPRFENYTPPAAGPNTLGRFSGEPSIGVGLGISGHPEGRAMFQSDVQTLRVTFNGSCAAPPAIWENKPAPTSQQDFDPILFTDRQTGRTFASLLDFAANPVIGEMSYTDTTGLDNDGDVWHPSQGTGVGSGIDHQTVGGGPFAPPLNIRPPGAYPNAVYYCSQALVDASCARSDNGGATFGPSVVAYQEATATSCGGLHGHIKVAPDGTVYLPNKDCGGEQGAVVSTDNGITWTIRHVPNSQAGGSDPSVGIGSGGRVYFGYADADTKPVIAMSDDKGVTWTQSLDVGSSLGINNVVFPAVVAGDNDRAAFAFIGTPTAGGLQGPKFTGIWHLYIAHTYDGGASWITVDATPNDPVQRGCIWLGGGANICRNLLDFMDVTIDQEGRVLVGYADGCAGGECVQAPTTGTGNSYTALAAIARQSGGRRLLSAFDPPNVATIPGTPFLTAKRNGVAVNLSWSEADAGTSAITGYRIYRGTSSGGESLLTSVGASQLTFADNTATNTSVTYFYRVTALNAQGESCGNNEVAARFVGDSCVGFTTSADPTGDQSGAPGNADLDIQSLKISEPGTGVNAGKIVFNLKVADLNVIPPQRMWRVVWNSPSSPHGQFYIGMTKDQNNVVTFDYGTVETQVVGLVLGVPTTHRLGAPDVSTFDATGLITIVVSRDKVGNPQAGDLLGGFSTRTYATVTDQIRSTNAIDVTANANANDNTANAQTYLMVGPVSSCAQGPPPAPGTLQFSAANYNVGEAAGSATITVTRANGSDGAVSVQYATSNGTATAGQDYTATSGTLNFAGGETSKTFTVSITDDSTFEGNETVNLALSNPQGGATLGTPSTATLTIADDDAPPSFAISDVTLAEGNAGTTSFTFTVTKSGATAVASSVNFATADGTAIAGQDYTSNSGTLNFSASDTSLPITVLVNGDLTVEDAETFFVNLSGATNATIADSQGIGTITNDDSVVQLSAGSYSFNEGDLFGVITVTRSGETSGAATVKFTTSDATDVNFQCNPASGSQPTGAASRKCDYHILSGRLRFAAGETSKQIILSLVNDVYVEPSESLTITLSNSTGVTLGTSSATINITDNDGGGAANPIDGTPFYVRMLYVDLLSREPDPAGYQGWIDRIDKCGQAGQPPPPCDRVTVGGDGFLRSAEFFEREFFVLRLYRAGLGRILIYPEVGDIAYVSGFLTPADLELNKQELVAEIMSRTEFSNKYNGLSNTSYVDTLIQTAAVTIPQNVRDGWVNALNGSTKTRAQVYRELSERQEVSDRYLHEAQVVSCYYGFFTRNPDGAYFNYLDRLDRGEINLGDLANAFINAREYKQRFGP